MVDLMIFWVFQNNDSHYLANNRVIKILLSYISPTQDISSKLQNVRFYGRYLNVNVTDSDPGIEAAAHRGDCS